MPTAPVSRLAGKAPRGARRAPRELSPPLSEAEESEEFSNSSGDEEEDIDGETLSDCSEASSGYLTEEEEEQEEVAAEAPPAVAAPAAAAQAAEPLPPQTPPPQQQEPRRRWDSHPDPDGEQHQRGNLQQAPAASKRSWRRYRYQIVEALFTFNGDRAAAKRYLLFNRGVLVPAAVLKYYYHRHYRKPLWPTAQDPGASPSPPRCWAGRCRGKSSKSSRKPRARKARSSSSYRL